MPRIRRSHATMLLLLSVTGMLCLGISARAADPVQASRRPNVLFLFTDDQRADTIAALGNAKIKTPNLDQLVKSGMVFNRAYCMGSMVPAVCLPSRTMMLTGRTLFHIQQTPQTPIFPQAMRDAGYATMRTGKQGNNPAWANDRFHTNISIGRSPTCTTKHADNAIEFLKKQTPQQPFFLYVALASPHDPRVGPQEYMDMYGPEDVDLPKNYLPVHPFDNGEMTVRDEQLAPWPRTPEVVRSHLADYYSVITYLDAEIGRIVQTLKDFGQYDNTIIIFSSDHGLAIGSHGLFGKQNIYEDGMRVPLIFAGPGIPQGKSTDAFAYLLDIFPTVCDLTGVKIPAGVEGKSLAPVIAGKADGVRDSLFTGYRVQRAVRDDRWKLIRYTHINKTQLFDLQDDPHETKDLAEDPAYKSKIDELMKLLGRWQKELDDPVALTSAEPKDPAWVPPVKTETGAKKKKGKK